MLSCVLLRVGSQMSAHVDQESLEGLKSMPLDLEKLRRETVFVSRAVPTNVGVIGTEVYFPAEYVSQQELEEYDGVGSGKYSIGLGQKNMAVCDNQEDIVSMCMTVVDNLLEKYGIAPTDIGRIEVGTETIADKSKSVKTFLMEGFNKAGCYDIQGIDTMNACYGGTQAFFNAVNWVESSGWDGRYAIVIAGDIAVYERGPARPTGGAGVVAMLVGPNSPIALETPHIASHMEHVYDFYKPHMNSEYPVVDGKLSNDCYMRSIDTCYDSYKSKYSRATGGKLFNVQSDADYAILHAPYTKLVQKSFARIAAADASDEELRAIREQYGEFDRSQIEKDRDVEKAVMKLFSPKYAESVTPTLQLSQECGNMYTGSVYAALCSLINSPEPKTDKRSLVFSYGSGLASSMFSLKFLGDVEHLRQTMNIDERLAARRKLHPEEYTERLTQRENKYREGVPTTERTFSAPKNMFAGTYYVKSIDPLGRKTYARTLRTATRALKYIL